MRYHTPLARRRSISRPRPRPQRSVCFGDNETDAFGSAQPANSDITLEHRDTDDFDWRRQEVASLAPACAVVERRLSRFGGFFNTCNRLVTGPSLGSPTLSVASLDSPEPPSLTQVLPPESLQAASLPSIPVSAARDCLGEVPELLSSGLGISNCDNSGHTGSIGLFRSNPANAGHGSPRRAARSQHVPIPASDSLVSAPPRISTSDFERSSTVSDVSAISPQTSALEQVSACPPLHSDTTQRLPPFPAIPPPSVGSSFGLRASAKEFVPASSFRARSPGVLAIIPLQAPVATHLNIQTRPHSQAESDARPEGTSQNSTLASLVSPRSSVATDKPQPDSDYGTSSNTIPHRLQKQVQLHQSASEEHGDVSRRLAAAFRAQIAAKATQSSITDPAQTHAHPDPCRAKSDSAIAGGCMGVQSAGAVRPPTSSRDELHTPTNSSYPMRVAPVDPSYIPSLLNLTRENVKSAYMQAHDSIADINEFGLPFSVASVYGVVIGRCDEHNAFDNGNMCDTWTEDSFYLDGDDFEPELDDLQSQLGEDYDAEDEDVILDFLSPVDDEPYGHIRSPIDESGHDTHSPSDINTDLSWLPTAFPPLWIPTVHVDPPTPVVISEGEGCRVFYSSPPSPSTLSSVSSASTTLPPYTFASSPRSTPVTPVACVAEYFDPAQVTSPQAQLWKRSPPGLDSWDEICREVRLVCVELGLLARGDRPA